MTAPAPALTGPAVLRAAGGWPARFVLLAGICGLSSLLIQVGVQAFAPLQVACGRALAGPGDAGLRSRPARRDHPVPHTAPTGLPIRPVSCVPLLGTAGTGVAYLLNYSIVRDAGATVASTVT